MAWGICRGDNAGMNILKHLIAYTQTSTSQQHSISQTLGINSDKCIVLVDVTKTGYESSGISLGVGGTQIIDGKTTEHAIRNGRHCRHISVRSISSSDAISASTANGDGFYMEIYIYEYNHTVFKKLFETF